MKKSLLIVLVFLLGYGIANYQFARTQLADEIDDYQREILIATRLLDEYSKNCNDNFSAYVEHSTTMYGNLISKAHGFPYFFNNEFINDHEESVFNFQNKITVNKNIIGACKKT